MKKVIFLSLMLLIVIFHASSVPVGMDDGEIIKDAVKTLSTDLVVNTKGELRPSIVGFTYDGEITSVDDNVTAIGADGIDLSIDATTGIASNAKPVYLYYQIVSGKKFTISPKPCLLWKSDKQGWQPNVRANFAIIQTALRRVLFF